MCARSRPFQLPWSPLTNRYIKLKQKFCKNNTHSVIHLGIFCSVYFLKKNASYSPLNWFHNPVVGPNPTGWKTQSKIISAQNNSKHSQGSLSKCCSSVPPRAGRWWRRRPCAPGGGPLGSALSALSVESPFRAPVGCAIKWPWAQILCQCWEVEVYEALQMPDSKMPAQCQVSQGCVSHPLDEAPPGGKASSPSGPHGVAHLAQLLSRVWLFETPWTVAHQAPLSVEFSRQGYYSRLPFPPPGRLPYPGIKPTSLALSALADAFFTGSASREALLT